MPALLDSARHTHTFLRRAKREFVAFTDDCPTRMKPGTCARRPPPGSEGLDMASSHVCTLYAYAYEDVFVSNCQALWITEENPIGPADKSAVPMWLPCCHLSPFIPPEKIRLQPQSVSFVINTCSAILEYVGIHNLIKMKNLLVVLYNSYYPVKLDDGPRRI
ncbi:hypothetical protein O181_100928 [Austropuccinia psidii MF-1]|uniref:Uncharacterized protein n=1 Tax=Austropuccinia psidii MF-1 TaxID=1389203 RepID=A0A9Q3PGL9_9BASI|nr:hypothetical protein [Austropuccinia psidii MF-1]